MTETYYKATQMDGTDFRTGRVNYAAALATGETITHPSAAMVQDDPSTYLSVSIAPADCTGAQWPCRLFVVELIGDILTATDLPNKRCCSALRVVEELPAWQALGPNGEAVAAHIERCKAITPEQGQKLWAASRDASWGASWDASWAAIWDASRAASRGASWAAIWGASRAARRNARWAASRAASWAAVALVVRDLITPEQFNELYGPWASVMEVTP